jgi:hypothetical protein
LAGSGWFAVSLLPMSPSIGGLSLTGIRSDPEHPEITLTGSEATVLGDPTSNGVAPHEIGVFVRSTASLILREKYSFLALHPARLVVQYG